MINYYLLIKPGIIFGNLVTFAAGFLLASQGQFHPGIFFSTLFALGLIIASACICNNYIDRYADQKMERTKNRPFASGAVKTANALLLAVLLWAAGNFLILQAANLLTAAVANTGFAVYVFLYSFLKSQTVYSTLIGSVAGAIPPLVGYCAVSGQLDLASAILFTIMIFWQMPHFFAIALWHRDDYARAGIPVLPVAKGALRTKIHMVLYIIGLIPTVALLTFFGYTGTLFLAVTASIGLIWLLYSVQGLKTDCDTRWGKQMFRLSLLMINAICLLIPLDMAG